MARKSEPEPSAYVAAFVESLSASHLECRELGHLWRPWRASISVEGNTYDRVLRCSRCKTERLQELSLRGHVIRNRYDYSDNYKSPPEVGRLVGDDRDVLRLESLKRQLGKGTKNA